MHVGGSLRPIDRRLFERVIVLALALVACSAPSFRVAYADGIQTAGDVLQFVPALAGLALTYSHDADAARQARIDAGDVTEPAERNVAYAALFGRDATGRLQLAESGALAGATTLILKAAV